MGTEIDRQALFQRAEKLGFPTVSFIAHENLPCSLGGPMMWQQICVLGCECIIVQLSDALDKISDNPLYMPPYYLSEIPRHTHRTKERNVDETTTEQPDNIDAGLRESIENAEATLDDVAQRLLDSAQQPSQIQDMQQQPQPLLSYFEITQRAILPPNGHQVQLVACQHCAQPMLLAIGFTVNGEPVAFSYCYNALCAGKRAGLIAPSGPFGQLPPPPRRR